ncbi:hypothetical protein FB192DRAFT_1434246 [Mucor lusitanicus]|uniref:C2H2-type domain-containing protein n=1 Tax=Mucor circinelloides f. lusitanicus TaxID=29924 RepID=A0A8H4F740_MUCCL|nr:hypothetical protein FB192DRAFT_1434246 [Mucor lusitanicus]
MKLRARKKRFPSNIKQEDCKPTSTLINAQLPTTEVAKSSTIDLIIKQEDSKDHKVLLKQHGEFGSKDYYYCCDICKLRLPNLKSVLEHRKSNHLSRPRKNRIVKNLDKEPDLYDPDFYCKSCEKGYSKKSAYRQHLRIVHYMVLQQLPARAIQNTDIAPNPKDPNFYCRACDFTYKINPDAKINVNDPDFYCSQCEHSFSWKLAFKKHLAQVHSII